MNRVFRIEFQRGFYSAGFYVGVILLTAAGAMGAGDIMEYMTEVKYLEGGLRYTEIVYHAICSEIFTFLVPIACTLAMSTSYLEDMQSGTLHYILLRTTKRKYRWSKVLNCALFGWLVVVAAVLILLMIFFVRYPMNSAEIEQWKTLDVTYYLFFCKGCL